MNINFKEIVKSKTFKGVLLGLAIAALVLAVFHIGRMVGFRKADFSFKWGENYHRNFGGPRSGFFGPAGGDSGDFLNPHGVFGEIIKIDGNEIVVRGNGEAEKIAVVGSDTVIQRGRDKIGIKDVKAGDNIVVVGAPDSGDTGKISAKLIRIMPAPMIASTTPPVRK